MSWFICWIWVHFTIITTRRLLLRHHTRIGRLVTWLLVDDLIYSTMHGSRKFCKTGSNFDNVFFVCLFLVDEGREDTRVINGPLAKRHRTNIKPNMYPTMNELSFTQLWIEPNALHPTNAKRNRPRLQPIAEKNRLEHYSTVLNMSMWHRCSRRDRTGRKFRTRLAPVLKTIFHQCVILYTCSQSYSDGSVSKQSHQGKTGYKYMIWHIDEKLL